MEPADDTEAAAAADVAEEEEARGHEEVYEAEVHVRRWHHLSVTLAGWLWPVLPRSADVVGVALCNPEY